MLHLEDHVDGHGGVKALAGDAQRLIDGRHRRLLELNVHGRAGDLNYLADVLCHVVIAFSKNLQIAIRTLLENLYTGAEQNKR